jgi:hypothetical protein
MSKYIFLFFFTVSLIPVSSCRKADMEYKSEGIITGPDYRMCACCGGWFITIDDQRYRFWSLPSGSNLDLEKEKFPLEVRLDWEMEKNSCMGDLIKVIRIEKK